VVVSCGRDCGVWDNSCRDQCSNWREHLEKVGLASRVGTLSHVAYNAQRYLVLLLDYESLFYATFVYLNLELRM
jgi:hypothetical protein